MSHFQFSLGVSAAFLIQQLSFSSDEIKWGELVSGVGFSISQCEQTPQDVEEDVLRFSVAIKNSNDDRIMLHKVGRFGGVAFYPPERGAQFHFRHIGIGPLGRGNYSRSALNIDPGEVFQFEFELPLEGISKEMGPIVAGINFWTVSGQGGELGEFIFSPAFELTFN